MRDKQQKPKKYSPVVWAIFIIASLAFILSSIWYVMPNTTTTETEPTIMASSKDFVSAAKEMGVTFDLAGKNLNIIADQKAEIAAIPSLQMLGAVNPAITQSDIESYPLTLAGGIAIFITTGIIPHIYRTTDADQIHVSIYMIPMAASGGADKHLLISFDFSRKLYERENWDNFPPKKLMEVAPNFKFDPWYQEQLKSE